MSDDFDIIRDFDKLASAEDNTPKGQLYRTFYRIITICTENWKDIAPDVQTKIIGAASQGLEITRKLP